MLSEEELKFGGKDPQLLKRFMQEFFPYSHFKKIGIFNKEMRGNYYAQAARICNRLGLKSIYEYGSKEIRCHLTYVDGKRPEGEPFVTVTPSIYE
ncbi:hypothetical protein [Chitinophaga nivalis]|uniref:Uncharacterized protein n=1 Tax=Chitinophaga nivalis TaxID=2991709 RepID=A0ABT3IIG4_9BACT|nr:hypothetical protein [Chitinophaga nivalis]MCW3466544.1 hypothetical protein [Chitinophaga nivalis]MCW3483765.1 hypothetical protein [Chitinophaga nivalis]